MKLPTLKILDSIASIFFGIIILSITALYGYIFFKYVSIPGLKVNIINIMIAIILEIIVLSGIRQGIINLIKR